MLHPCVVSQMHVSGSLDGSVSRLYSLPSFLATVRWGSPFPRLQNHRELRITFSLAGQAPVRSLSSCRQRGRYSRRTELFQQPYASAIEKMTAGSSSQLICILPTSRMNSPAQTFGPLRIEGPEEVSPLGLIFRIPDLGTRDIPQSIPMIVSLMSWNGDSKPYSLTQKNVESS